MSWIDTAFQAAGAALSFLSSGNNTGSGGGIRQAKGSAAIQAFVNQVLAALDQIAAQVGQLSASQRSAASGQVMNDVNQLVSTLSNQQYVYQAKRGDDAAILQRGKASAAQKAQEIAMLLQGSPAATGTTGTTTGTATGSTTGIITGTGATLGNQTDNTTLYLIGGAALVVILLTRRK